MYSLLVCAVYTPNFQFSSLLAKGEQLVLFLKVLEISEFSWLQ